MSQSDRAPDNRSGNGGSDDRTQTVSGYDDPVIRVTATGGKRFHAVQTNFAGEPTAACTRVGRASDTIVRERSVLEPFYTPCEECFPGDGE